MITILLEGIHPWDLLLDGYEQQRDDFFAQVLDAFNSGEDKIKISEESETGTIEYRCTFKTEPPKSLADCNFSVTKL